MKLLSRPRVPLCHLLLAINVLTVCWGTEAATLVAPSASDGPKPETSGAKNETSPQEQEPTQEGQQLQQQQQQQQTSKHHRHRRENGGFTIGDGMDGIIGGGGGPGAGAGMVDGENFIALAPDETDIYNFPNMMSMTMANERTTGGGATGGGGGMRDRNVNEANPFNEFHPSRRDPPSPPGGRQEVDEQLPRPRTAGGEKELPELTLDDDDGGGGGGDDDDEDGADGAENARSPDGVPGRRTEPRRRSSASFRDVDDDQDGGNGGEVQEEEDGEEGMNRDEEDDNAIERSRFLRRPAGGDNDEDDGTTVASSRTESDAALLSKGLDLLNSLDGAYLLANARIASDRGKVAVDEEDGDISTRKPIAPDTEQGGNGGNARDGGGGGTDPGENEIFEQMEKKAKSYRLKLYKKHKNFKHTHHHRGGLYHQPYHTFHHDYYRRKMLERERERWKKMQDAKPDYQGQISYYENSNKLATNEDILAHLNGGHGGHGGGGGGGGGSSSSSQEKWPNFDRVMSSLKTEPKPDNVPPYIKKYNRRNKQLIDLLEGTIAPLSDYSVHKHRERKYHRRKNPHWMEEDLFEEQRPSQSKGQGMQRNYIQETIQSSTIHSNALPGEGIHIIYDKKHGAGGGGGGDHDDLDDGSHLMYGRPTISSGHGHDGGVAAGGGGGGAGGHPNYKLSSRAGQFVYHRVASPQPLGGAGGYGRLKRQRLPFVAITDRRLSAPPKRRPGVPSSANNNGGPNNPLLNHQPLP